jgi:hypothetical protein
MSLAGNEFFISALLGVAAFALVNAVFEIRFFEGLGAFFLHIFETLAEHLGRYNTLRYLDRIKKEGIVLRKETVYVKYNRLVEGILLDFNIPLTLEAFTSLIFILFALVVLVIVFFMKNVTVSVVMGVSLFVGLLTYFSMQSKSVQAERLENIMDAEDVICPLARDGVLLAMKQVMRTEEYISANLRPYFRQFIDNCENQGYSFKQAMAILNKQLGPKFDNFSKKAVIFEYNERKGMADIFLDIVDDNAVLREITTKKDRMFRKMNREFLFKTLIILLFFLYALSVEEFRRFMMESDAGKIINMVAVSVICLMFAASQSLQGNLTMGGAKR